MKNCRAYVKSVVLVFLSVTITTDHAHAGVASEFPRDSVALASVNFSNFVLRSNGERKLMGTKSEIGKFIFGSSASVSGQVVLGQCGPSAQGVKTVKNLHSLVDIFPLTFFANNSIILDDSEPNSLDVAISEFKGQIASPASVTYDEVEAQSLRKLNSSMAASALLQAPRITECGSKIWTPPEGEPWVALVPEYGTLEHVRSALQLNASAVLIYNATFREPRLTRNETTSLVLVALSPVVGAEVAELIRGGSLIYVSLRRTHHNYAANINRTSVLFVSVSFILLMIVSLAWLVFYYVQRFRYINAKDRLQKHLSNAAKKALSKIPVKSIKLGDKELQLEECCAVCLEAYTTGDAARVLPCRHEFHKACVDPWLLDHRTCPMCKMDILRHYGYNLAGSSDNIIIGIIDDDPNLGTGNVNNVLTHTLTRSSNAADVSNLYGQHPVLRASITPSSTIGASSTSSADSASHAAAQSPVADATTSRAADGDAVSSSAVPSADDVASDPPSRPCMSHAPGDVCDEDVTADAGVSEADAPKSESFLRTMLDTARSRVPFSARNFGKNHSVDEGKTVANAGQAALQDLVRNPSEDDVSASFAVAASSRGLGDNIYGFDDESSLSLSLRDVRRPAARLNFDDVDSVGSHEFTDALEHVTPLAVVRSKTAGRNNTSEDVITSSDNNNKRPKLSDSCDTSDDDDRVESCTSDASDWTEPAVAHKSCPGGTGEGAGLSNRDNSGLISATVANSSTRPGRSVLPGNKSFYKDKNIAEEKRTSEDTVKKRDEETKTDIRKFTAVHSRGRSDERRPVVQEEAREESLPSSRGHSALGYFQLSEVEENDPTLRDMRPRVFAGVRNATLSSGGRRSGDGGKVQGVRSSRSISGLSSYATPTSADPLHRKKSEPELSSTFEYRERLGLPNVCQNFKAIAGSGSISPHAAAAVGRPTVITPHAPLPAHTIVHPTPVPATGRSSSPAAVVHGTAPADQSSAAAVKTAQSFTSAENLSSRRRSTPLSYCSPTTDMEDLKRRLTILSDQLPLSPEFLPETGVSTSKSRHDLSKTAAARRSSLSVADQLHGRNVSVHPMQEKKFGQAYRGNGAVPKTSSHSTQNSLNQNDDPLASKLSDSRPREVEVGSRRSRKVAPVSSAKRIADEKIQKSVKRSVRSDGGKEKPITEETDEAASSGKSSKNVLSVSYA
ncbi:uncharacterized protein LOC108665430 [Hyalella azteca]|uniref:Uncharacterized protein LOC108665430 n=1 Tax=Hyalella azteca TaxID=294128 RepID=A0A8B7N1G4_HYAAZ|nr:uncharacterized protein LOC108665430 [Hyalella azteca]